jgi:hypothetical protein
MVWDSACVGDMKLLLSKYMEILFWQDHYMIGKYCSHSEIFRSHSSSR